MLLADWSVGQVLWSMIWFFLFFIWIWLLIMVFVDIFRSHDLNGWVKALWVIFVIVLPFLGVFVDLIARGGKMADREMKRQADAQAQFNSYVRDVASTSGGGSGGTAAELERLANLKASGTITEDEFNQLKAKAISGS